MAEAAREKKLAAARKKLKKYQKSIKDTSNLEPLTEVNKKEIFFQLENPNSNNNHQVREKQVEKVENLTHFNSSTNDTPNFDTISSISSTESIRQISLQLNGLMSESDNFLNGVVDVDSSATASETEKRNLELAASIEKHVQTNEHLLSQIHELTNQNNKLRQENKKQKEESEARHLKEQSSLKEQLQVHIQTIGILVAEKTELQSSLTQSQQSAKQKAAEVEELQGRLKANRQRVSDLEKDINLVQTSSQQFEKSSKEFSREIDRLKLEIYKNQKRMEEMEQENYELTEKLNNKLLQSQTLQEQLDSTKSTLAMSELRIQQLSGSDDNKQLWEELTEEKIQLAKKVTQLKEALSKLSQERDSMSEQHQQFSQQLNEQMQHLTQQITSQIEEKAALNNEKIVLSNRVHSLEEDLKEANKRSLTSPIANDEIERLQSILQVAEDEKLRLQEQRERDLSDNAHLGRLVEELELKVEKLENQLESSKEEEAGRKLLLEEIESDKIAASRAVAQNRELKKQLEELQNGFITMSNKKLELAEKLESEQHISKELGERLTQQEEELKELRQQLSIHDQEPVNPNELSKQMYQQQQLMDRVHHYEARSQLAELLQKELNETQDRLNVISAQNNELRTLLTQQGRQEISNKRDGDSENSRKDDLVASLSASVRQLEMERNSLLKQLGQQQGQREVFKAQLKEMKDNNLHQQMSSESGQIMSTLEYEGMKEAMGKLEERFTKTMKEIADLSDQKQQLEHVVTQLQGETETIGEYIALYQVQRGILKQRAMEKDEYIANLARDREDMRHKLATLQDLVMRLLYERQQYSNGQAETIHPPGKAVPSTETASAVNMTALNGAESLPNWPDLEDEFNKLNSTLELNKSAGNELESKDTTAKKIMDLITEIGSSSLIDTTITENFHPCPVCSGKLMTV